MSILGGPDIVESGLVLYLDAANRRSYPGSGTAWTDMSGNALNGTLTNGPTFSSTNGGSINFDGTNDYVDNGTNNLLNLTTALTITSWHNPDTSGGGTFGRIISRQTGSPQNTGYALFVYDVGYTLQAPSAADNFRNVGTAGGLTFGVWNFVSVTYDGSTVRFYNNGDFISSASLANIVSATGGTCFVGNRSGADRGYDGRLANVSVYNRVLSATEILQNYNATRSRFGL